MKLLLLLALSSFAAAPKPAAVQGPKPLRLAADPVRLGALDGFFRGNARWDQLESALLGSVGVAASESRADLWTGLAAERLRQEPGIPPSRALSEALAEAHRLSLETAEALEETISGRSLDRAVLELPEESVAQPGRLESFRDDWREKGLRAALQRSKLRKAGHASRRGTVFRRFFEAEGEVYGVATMTDSVGADMTHGRALFKLEGARWVRVLPSFGILDSVDDLIRHRGRFYAATSKGLLVERLGRWVPARAGGTGAVSSLAVHDGKLWAAGKEGLWMKTGRRVEKASRDESIRTLRVEDGKLYAAGDAVAEVRADGSLRGAFPPRPTLWNQVDDVVFQRGRWRYATPAGLRSADPDLKGLTSASNGMGRGLKRFKRTRGGLLAFDGAIGDTGEARAMLLGGDGTWTRLLEGSYAVTDLAEGFGLLWWVVTDWGLKPMLAPLAFYELELGRLLAPITLKAEAENTQAAAAAEKLQDSDGRDLFAP